jgi:hypothetical protein
VIEVFTALAGGIDENLQLLGDVRLALELFQGTRPQRLVRRNFGVHWSDLPIVVFMSIYHVIELAFRKALQ